MEERTCRKCDVTQPIEGFNRNPKSTGGRQWKCKSCERQYRIDNASRIRSVQAANRAARAVDAPKGRSRRDPIRRRKHARLKEKYGISVETYEDMLAAQGSCCRICNVALTGETYATKPCVDHCHETKRVRGILCAFCNIALGFLKDDPARLARAIEYLNQ